MQKSTHKVEIVQIKLEPHPNAEKLSIVKVFDGYQVCVNTADWKDGQLAAYIPPDSLVDTTRPEFQFLGEHKHIKAKKLRGIVSMGLMVPAPEGAQLGDDVAERLGVTHYEPMVTFESDSETEAGPVGYFPTYDIDSMLRYASVFKPGEPVWVTEKIHGANSRYCCRDGKMYAGSRTTWKKQNERNQWWAALQHHPEIVEWCQAHPDCTLYAELYGNVQSLKYGVNGVRIAVFDILRRTEWVNPEDALVLGPKLPWVPLLKNAMPFDLEALKALADGPSTVPGAKNIREGIVVKPLLGRTDPTIGRVILKIVGSEYLAKSK